jgi:hypothetical protein
MQLTNLHVKIMANKTLGTNIDLSVGFFRLAGISKTRKGFSIEMHIRVIDAFL